MESVLILNGINKNFGNFCALKDINLEVKKGEFVCFLGPSGCGKTTLLRIISGLENQNSGEIVYENKNISKLHPSERNFGMVFQSYALFPNLTAEDNIKFGLKNRKLTKEEINEKTEEVLNTIGLYDIRKKHPGQLSGGQQQRVALARVLALSPELLLLDEPLSALDAKVRIKLRKELKNLQKNLLLCHDLFFEI